MNKYLLYLLVNNQWFGLSGALKQDFYRQVEGYKGERKFADLIQSDLFTGANWECLLDRTVAEDGLTQIDALLLLPEFALMINVKHYTKAQPQKGGQRISYQTTRQLENSRLILWSIFDKLDIRYPLKTALVFMNEQVPQVELAAAGDKVNYVIQASEVLEWLLSLKRAAALHPRKDYRGIVKTIDFHSVPELRNNRQVAIRKDDFLARCRKNAPCPYCHQALGRKGERIYSCPNGHQFFQRQIIQWAIAAFCLLTESETFTRRDVETILPMVKRRALINYLNDNFERKGIGRNTHYLLNYQSKTSLYSIWQDQIML